MSFQTQVVINFLKHMSAVQRRVELEKLLRDFPDEWLNDAIQIAQAVRQGRQPLGAQAVKVADNFGKAVRSDVTTGTPVPWPKPITPSAEYKRYP